MKTNNMETALEHVLMSMYKEGMIDFINKHPEAFDEAVRLALTNKQPYAWRAAWLLWSCMCENDKRIAPYVTDIVNALNGKNDGHQRELLKILYLMDIDDTHEGFLFDLCVGIWEKINKQPSVRINALKIVIKIAQKHLELYNEISFLTQSHYVETLSPGVKNAVERLIAEQK